MLQRGGTHHTRLGWDAQRGALRIIEDSAREMSPAKRRQVIQALEDVLQQRESPSVQATRVMAYHDRIGGWHARFNSVISELAPRPVATTPAYSEDTWAELTLRGTQLKLAVIQFENDRGRKPVTLMELAPEYLDNVPLDPHSGQPLLIRSEGFHSYVLYSVGHDGIDNGGNFAADYANYYNQPGYDLKLPPQ